jgi:hypothetical protein
MARYIIKITPGEVYNRWTVLEEAPRNIHNYRCWWCRCVCGTVRSVVGRTLVDGSSKSCGCLQQNACDHRTDHPLYTLWHSMIQRCTCPTDDNFPRYGGRGITVCERWCDFALFLADMGPRPSSKHTLERLDNNRGYEPGNVVWATYAQQLRNTRRNRWLTFNGETKCVTDWASQYRLAVHTITLRLQKGWPVGAALTTPRYVRYRP